MRKLFLLMMALFISGVGMLRANELTVYDGTVNNGQVPVYGLYADAYHRSQFIMPASELSDMEGGEISEMKFYTTSNYPTVSWTATFSVYLKEVAQTSINAYINPATATVVYQGRLSVANNVMTVTFNTPFAYEGGNLLIGFDCINTGNYVSCYFFGQTVAGASVGGYSYSSLAQLNCYQKNFIPKTTFVYTNGVVVPLAVEPEPLHLGARPNGAWMRPFEATVFSNIGTTQVTAIDSDNPYFVMQGLELPATVAGNHGYTFNITTGEAEEGRIEANLALINAGGRGATLVPITAYAYDPERPDVWELARVVTSFPYTERDPNTYIANNYQLPGTTPDGPDEVFKVTFANDVVFNTDFYPIINKGEGGRDAYSFKSAIYAEDFNGEPGPGPDNAFSFGVVEGEFFEDFETGVLSEQWSNDASYPWTVTGGAYAGNFCAKSGNSGVGSSESKLTLNYTVPVDGVVAFYMKFSGEGSSWDIPKFYLDGVLKTPAYSWPSGGNDWTRYEYPVTAGAHTFTWAYKKDSSINQGQDCAWVDNITIGTPADRSNDVITDMFVPAGTYYVVTSAKNVSYDVTLRAEAAPAPIAASNPTPADGAQGINTPVSLKWTLGEYTKEYQLLLGTTYPPTQVVVDWTSTLSEVYRTAELFNNTQYFWQVNERNSAGTTNGPVWGFTTTINVPQNLTAADNTIFEGQTAQFTWQANNRAFRGYNIYQDGVKLNDALITATNYSVAGLAYNMEGYDFNVTAVYDEGESNPSNTVTIFVSGEGLVSGTVYEQDEVTPIEGVTVTFNGRDEFNDPHTYTFVTGADGSYEGNLYAGVYTALATADGYQDTPYREGNIEIYFEEETSEIDFVMCEVYYPVLEVIAEEVDDTMVKVYWNSYAAPTIIEDFETGGFESFEWNNTISTYPWAITTTNPYEGTYCMKSTCEGVGSGNSSIEVTVEIPTDGLMSFYGKPSCENGWDFGRFYIDGVEKGSYTGNGNWGKNEFEITEGTHTFKWSYVKDATVNSNDDCFYVDLIDFCHQPEPLQPGWIYYDDGTNNDAIGLTAGGSFYWGIMFPASQMAGFNGYSLTKVAYFDYAAHTGKVLIYQGGDTAPGTLVHQQNYTANGTSQYVEWDLTSAIPVDPTKNLWIVMNNDNGQYVAAGGTDTGNPNGRWISLDGVEWSDIAALGLSYTWNLRGYVSNRNARNLSVATDDVVELTPIPFVNNATGGVLGTDPKAVDRKPIVAAPAMVDSRSFQYYNIYRTGCYDEEDVQLMASHVTDTVYMDMSWVNTPAGVYKWGVSRVYEGNRESRIQWANPTREAINFNFDEGLQGWTTIDADGDGYVWLNLTSLIANYAGNGHNGSNDAVCSQSYRNSVGVLYPDNYLVSPVQYALGTGASVSFYACAQDEDYAAEHFGVAISTTGNTSAANFTTIQEWTLTAKGARTARPRGTRQGNWYEFTADLSAYAGQNVWIAIRHFNCSDEFVLLVDDVTISTGASIVPPVPGGEHESDIVWSNCLDKDMWTTVDVTVTTNSQDSPEGTTVTLVNMTEPEMGYDLEVELDDTGYHMWDEVRKGTYVVTMNKEGFESCYVGDEIEIWDATSLECMLEEIIFAVEGLYTSHTGWAMWAGDDNINPTPNPSEGDEFEFNFDNNMEGWTTIDADGDGNNFLMLSSVIMATGNGHNASNDALSSQSYINYVGPLSPDNYVVTPQKYAIGSSSVFSFYACAQDAGYAAEHFGVAISTTGNTSAADFTTIQEWTMTAKGERYEGPRGSRAQGNWYNYTVDLSAYAGQEVWIAIRHFNCTDWFMLNVDDATLSNGSRGERSIEMYKVMLDGVFEGNTTRNFFQHNVENLVEGQEYTTQVQAIYSTGASDWSEYVWVYNPCDNYNGTLNGVTAEVVGQDALISWAYPGNDTVVPNPTGDEFEFNFDNNMEGWTTIDADGDGNNFLMLSSVIMATGNGHNASNDALSSQSYINYVGPLSPDNYVVTPQKYAIGSSSVFSFWACAQDAGYAAEHFGVAISTTGNTSAADFTTIQEWTMTAKGERYEGKRGSRAQGNWYNYTVDLSAYAGQEVWIAVRHFNCTDWFMLNVDDATLSTGARTRAILFDQSQMVTNPGAGANGCDVAALQGGQGTFGPNVSWAYGNGNYYLLGDDFTLQSDATINEIEVYAYQTGSSTTSTFNGMYIQIYDGNPMTGGQVVWGDNSTNLMTTSAFTGIYRTTSTELTNSQRPIMSITASDLNIALPAGQYWLQWGLTGSLSSGPWGMPVCIAGQTITGDGLHKQDAGWVALTDGSTNEPYGVAFKISGQGGNTPPVPVGDILGAVVYRDGEYLGFTSTNEYLDVNPGDGDFEYCVRVVYNGPMDGTYYSMSCPECAELSMELTCDAPENLNGEYVWNTASEFGAMISWGEQVVPVESWLFYDDGANVDAIGLAQGGSFYWGIMIPSSMLQPYAGTVLTKVAYFDYAAHTGKVMIYQGGATAPGTLVHQQNYTANGTAQYVEWELTSAIPVDVTQNLWIVMNNNDGQYVAACGNDTGDANGRWISIDGTDWMDVTAAGIQATWNLRGFVTNTRTGELVPVEAPALNGTPGATLATAGESRQGDVVMDFTARDLALVSYKVYRSTSNDNYSLIATVPAVEGQDYYEYFDQVEAGTYYYQVTAYYEGTSGTCESEPAISATNSANNYVIVNVTSVDGAEINARVYPNPTNGNVTIEAVGMKQITVVSALGQVIYDREVNSDSEMLNMAEYKAGIYMVRIATENGVSVQRVTVVR